jgi:hypothetical protein
MNNCEIIREKKRKSSPIPRKRKPFDKNSKTDIIKGKINMILTL